jgi:hypothetical protein
MSNASQMPVQTRVKRSAIPNTTPCAASPCLSLCFVAQCIERKVPLSKYTTRTGCILVVPPCQFAPKRNRASQNKRVLIRVLKLWRLWTPDFIFKADPSLPQKAHVSHQSTGSQ